MWCRRRGARRWGATRQTSPEGAQATAISLCAAKRVDQVGVTLSNGTTLTHGGSGGTYSSLTLGNNEYVTSAYLCQAKHNNSTRIFYAKFTTNLGRTLAGGSTTDNCVTRTAPPGWQIAGFHGRSGAEVDEVGFIFTPKAVMLVNRATGKCLEVSDWSAANSAKVQQWTCHGGANQRWRIEPLTDGTSRIVKPQQRQGARRGRLWHRRRRDHPAVRLVNDPCQRWSATEMDSGWVRLLKPNSGKVTDVADCNDATDPTARSAQMRSALFTV